MTVTDADQVISTVAVSPGIPRGYCVDVEVGYVDLKVPDHDASKLSKLGQAMYWHGLAGVWELPVP